MQGCMGADARTRPGVAALVLGLQALRRPLERWVSHRAARVIVFAMRLVADGAPRSFVDSGLPRRRHFELNDLPIDVRVTQVMHKLVDPCRGVPVAREQPVPSAIAVVGHSRV
jgi:hypothetical protein